MSKSRPAAIANSSSQVALLRSPATRSRRRASLARSSEASNTQGFLKQIPQFPHFKKATLADNKAYTNYYLGFDPYSDFSFNNLWSWLNARGGLAFSRHNDNIVLRVDNAFSHNRQDYTILGREQCADTFRAVLAWQGEHDLRQELVMVPEQAVFSSSDIMSGFAVEEDRNSFDYVYDLHDLVAARGKDYASYRYSVNSYRRRYPNSEVCEIDVSNYDECQRIIDGMHAWGGVYRDKLHAVQEGRAINECLIAAYNHKIQLKCLGVLVDGVLQAFLLYQRPGQDGYVIANFLKYNRDNSFMFDGTFSEAFRQLLSEGFSYINLEQDLGIEGLRAHKLQLRPVRYLKRYTIKPKS